MFTVLNMASAVAHTLSYFTAAAYAEFTDRHRDFAIFYLITGVAAFLHLSALCWQAYRRRGEKGGGDAESEGRINN